MKTELYLHDDLVIVTIDVDYDACHQEAKVCGLPEDCCPADSSLELNDYKVLSIAYEDDETPRVSKEDIAAEWVASEERIEQECWDHFMEQRGSDFDEE